MKLMKWLKSEIEVSPSNKKRATDSPASGKPTELCRNESYLKALTKFNQWRQSHLKVLASKQQKSKAKSFSAGDECGGRESTSPKPNDTQPYYEEIDCKADTPLYDTANESKLVQHDDDDDEDEDEDDGADEHLYSIPLQDYSNAPSSSTHHDECLEECFDAWNRKQCKQETASKRSRLITDLDKSQDFITAVEEVNSLSDVTTVAADDASFTAGLKLLSETVVCAMSEIKVHNEYPQCNIKNFFIRHGTVNAMDTSFLQMKGIDYNIIYSNSEAMRKLRHPNLILLLGISLDTNSKLAALLLEPVECSLYDRIYYRETHIPLDTCHKYALQLTSAVGYLHMRGLIHTNICSENVLLCGAAGMAVKLAGFELSSTTQDNNRKCLNQMSSSQPKCRQLSAEFRRRYTTYFYQAPELLSNTADHITATYYTDIYGICITLWEMLNCVIPYMQFSYDELLKVFSLRRAQLTAYDRRRQQPFNELLEKGLEIESGQRFRTADELKDALNHIRLDSPSEAFNWNLTFEKHLRERNNFAAPSHSTLRRAYENVSPCSSQPSLDRSDIKVEIPGSDAEIKSPNSFGGKVLKTSQTVERDTVENRRTPSRKFNVSILIKSKSNVSANLSGAQRIDISPITGNSTNGRQIACERYEIRLKSPINGGAKNAANKMEERKIQCINCDCSDGKQRGGNAAASTVEPQAELVTTEDFYIDDDFAQQSCAQVGANFQMEFNYECL